MRNVKLQHSFFYFFLALSTVVHAQEKYIAEIGVLGGSDFYLGDAESVPFQQMGGVAGGFIKYKLDNRYSFGIQSAGGYVNIPPFENLGTSKISYCDIEATAEFNFFDFGYDKLHSTTKRATPFIFAGIGCCIYNTGAAVSIPFGVGGKFKLSKRFNLGVTWSMNKLFSDNFDKINNPRGLNKSPFMNSDWYSKVTVYLSFDFWKYCKECHSGLNVRRNGIHR